VVFGEYASVNLFFFVGDEIFKIVGVSCLKVQDKDVFNSLVLNASIRDDLGLCVPAQWTKSCPLSLVALPFPEGRGPLMIPLERERESLM
jgi:hypothetical protein